MRLVKELSGVEGADVFSEDFLRVFRVFARSSAEIERDNGGVV